MIGDRIRETSTTIGTGTLDLQGAVTGHVTFGTGIGNGKTCYYVITDGVDWEEGIGTVTTGTPDRLSRDSVVRSTNSNAKVNWAAGTRTVFCFPPAQAIGWGGYGIPTAVMTESDGSLYEVTMAPAVITLRDGVEIDCFPDEANTGPTSLKVNDTAEKSICLDDGSALVKNELQASKLGRFKYSSTLDKWMLLNPQDDEGTWTPVLGVVSGTDGSHTYARQVGRYVRRRKVVNFWGRIELSAKDVAMAGAAAIKGLPYAAQALANFNPSVAVGQHDSIDIDVAGGYYAIAAHVIQSSTRINLVEVGDNLTAANLTQADFGNTSGIMVSGSYRTD